MANPIMKMECINKDNPLFGLTAIGHIRVAVLNYDIHNIPIKDLAFCVQVDDTTHALANCWYIQNRQDWSNTDAKRPQTKDQRRPARRTYDNVEDYRKPAQKTRNSNSIPRSESK